jgi:predicted kinase
MQTLYIMCGVGFSGKSTLAKKISEYTGAVLISQDQLFFEKEKELGLDIDSDNSWQILLNICKEQILSSLKAGHSVVFDSVNTKYEHRQEIRDLARIAGVKSKVVFLDTPIEIQRQRQENNKTSKARHDVKQEYLDQAISELEIPKLEEEVLTYTTDTTFDDFKNSL